MAQKLLRFSDLQARKIVPNRTTLQRRIANDGFPSGFLLGPNSRAWNEDDVEAWVIARQADNTALSAKSQAAKAAQLARLKAKAASAHALTDAES